MPRSRAVCLCPAATRTAQAKPRSADRVGADQHIHAGAVVLARMYEPVTARGHAEPIDARQVAVQDDERPCLRHNQNLSRPIGGGELRVWRSMPIRAWRSSAFAPMRAKRASSPCRVHGGCSRGLRSCGDGWFKKPYSSHPCRVTRSHAEAGTSTGAESMAQHNHRSMRW